MSVPGHLFINDVEFEVREATFRYITDADGGWEFDVRTKPSAQLDDEHPLAGYAPRFYAEGDPIPLERRDDLTGLEVHLETPFDEDTGEVYFTLYVFEHGDLADLTLRLSERDGDFYRMRVMARIPAGSVLSDEAQLKIDSRIQRLPDGSYEDE